MKIYLMGAAIAAQALAVGPAAAAELVEAAATMPPQRGAFAGAQLRVPLGRTADKARAGLAIAGLERSRMTGAQRMSQGLALGVDTAGKLQLAAGGRTLDREEQRKMGVSTLGWVAIGVGAAVVVGVVGYGLWLNHELSEPHD
jgi:hypothetical protein